MQLAHRNRSARAVLIQWDTTASPDGECSLKVEAIDLAGNVAIVRRSVVVQNRRDCTPPQLTLSPQPSRLWPVNSGLVPVTFTGTVSDAGSRITTVSFQTRDEYERVQPTGTAPVSDNGRFHITVLLEAGRQGGDRDGRRYVITVSASDSAGNHTTATGNAIVSHDSRD